MFWNRKKTTAAKMPEPSPEQLKEEQEFAERNASEKRTTTGETTKILNLTLHQADKAIEEKRRLTEKTKKLHESIAQAGASLQPKKA